MASKMLRFFSPFKHTKDFIDGPNKCHEPITTKIDFMALEDSLPDDLHKEENRLKTFDYWPVTFLDKHNLARIGFYYTGIWDTVKCYFCKVEIGKWEIEDHALSEHLRWSSNCPLLRRRETFNVPIDAAALDRILPPLSYDTCGPGGLVTIRPSAFAESSFTSRATSSTNTSAIGVDIPPATMAPYSEQPAPPQPQPMFTNSNPTLRQTQLLKRRDFPELEIEANRLATFKDWPINLKMKPQELSDAGFFYTGVGDRVQCFSCGGGLKDWEDSDSAWQQHAIWYSNCEYLKLMKGQKFIDAARNSYLSAKDKNELNDENGGETSSSRTSSSGFESNDEESQIPENKLCKICYSCEFNTAFLPCGHVVACAKCASSVTKCPMCREPFTSVTRIYFS